MRFVLEESSWAWDGQGREAYIEKIEQLLDRLDVVCERQEGYAASEELLSQNIFAQRTLADLLWNRDSPLRLPIEVLERISALFGRMHRWDEDIAWPEDFEVLIDGKAAVSPSAAFTRQLVSQGKATACLPLPGLWKGLCRIAVKDREVPVHFVVDESTHRAFFRDALNVERTNEAGLEVLAPHAFPDLCFLPGLWDGIRHFAGGYARVRDKLHELLAVLDDYGAWAFTDLSDQLSRSESVPYDTGESQNETSREAARAIIQNRFKQWGLEIAPESPDVRKDSKCRRARARTLENRTLYCEWHYKFDPNVNRAHIHPPVPESKGKLIIAIFRDHLPLPGK